MDVLVFGGSFDPPHRGHLRILRAALRFQKPDLAYLVPSFRTPLKGPPSASPKDRVRMLELALKELPAAERRRVRIETYELRRRKLTYAHEVIAHLRKKHPDAALHLLMGSDCLKIFRFWRHWKRILKEARLLVGARPGSVFRSPRGVRANRLPGRFPDIASTGLRRRIAAGEDVSKEVPTKVLQYAERRGLYGTDLLRWLRTNLGPGRVRHVLAVTRLTVDLAHAHGLDVDRARTAALLHDVGRSMAPGRLVRYVRRHGIRVPLREEVIRHRPMMLHAYAGAHLARTRFGVRDREVLAAIARHTLGGAGMGPLARLLYVADASSEDRTYPGAKIIRRKAFRNLNTALKEAVRRKLAWVELRGQWLHPEGRKLWKELQTKS